MHNVLELLKKYAETGALDLEHVLGVLHGNACEAQERIEQLEARLDKAETRLAAVLGQKAAAPMPPAPPSDPTP